MGLTFDQLYPGTFIKAGEMHGKPVTLTIKSVAQESIEGDDGTEKLKVVITFVEIGRKWIANKTNGLRLRAMFGNDSDDWIGKRVTIFPEHNSMSESGFAIRVKGSPDLERTMVFDQKLARKKPVPVKLEKTTAGKGEARLEEEQPKDRPDYGSMEYPDGLLDDLDDGLKGGFDDIGGRQ